MQERRFVATERRLGDSVRTALRSAIEHSPSAIAKVRAKRVELDAYVAAALITPERANTTWLKFASLIIAHVREHGPDAPEDAGI